MNQPLKTPSLERVRYYPRQLMTAEDMRAEQAYFLERNRRHNRMLHGWGIVCGLSVQAAATAEQPWRVLVCPGFAVSPLGDDISVPAPVHFDLARPAESGEEPCTPCPCPPDVPDANKKDSAESYLAIRFAERAARPVRTGQGDCGCTAPGCETTRIRDGFELGLLGQLPNPYDTESRNAEEAYWAALAAAQPSGVGRCYGLPTPPCLGANVGPWVILALIQGPIQGVPKNLTSSIGGSQWRRVLLRAQDLSAAGK